MTIESLILKNTNIYGKSPIRNKHSMPVNPKESSYFILSKKYIQTLIKMYAMIIKQ